MGRVRCTTSRIFLPFAFTFSSRPAVQTFARPDESLISRRGLIVPALGKSSAAFSQKHAVTSKAGRATTHSHHVASEIISSLPTP